MILFVEPFGILHVIPEPYLSNTNRAVKKFWKTKKKDEKKKKKKLLYVIGS